MASSMTTFDLQDIVGTSNSSEQNFGFLSERGLSITENLESLDNSKKAMLGGGILLLIILIAIAVWWFFIRKKPEEQNDG